MGCRYAVGRQLHGDDFRGLFWVPSAMAFWPQLPVCPGLRDGPNAFFAYTIVLGMGVSWQVALGIVLLEGLIFIVLSILLSVSPPLVNSIPMGLKAAISWIGLFIAFIGLRMPRLLWRIRRHWWLLQVYFPHGPGCPCRPGPDGRLTSP